jgi:hypothetical protein
MENEWTRLLEHMRKTLAEREEFIQSVISDNVKLQVANDDMLAALLMVRGFACLRGDAHIHQEVWEDAMHAVTTAIQKAGESC